MGRVSLRPDCSSEYTCGLRVTPRTDIYSLGVVLYELLTGRRPFKAENEDVLRQQILSGEPWPLRTIDNHIPKRLEEICLKAVSKEPGQRYATAADMAKDLRDWLDHRSEPQSGGPDPQERPIRQRWSRLAAVGFLAFACMRRICWAVEDVPGQSWREIGVTEACRSGGESAAASSVVFRESLARKNRLGTTAKGPVPDVDQ